MLQDKRTLPESGGLPGDNPCSGFYVGKFQVPLGHWLPALRGETAVDKVLERQGKEPAAHDLGGSAGWTQ